MTNIRFELTEEPVHSYSGIAIHSPMFDGSQCSVSHLRANACGDQRRFVRVTVEDVGLDMFFDVDETWELMLKANAPADEFSKRALELTIPTIKPFDLMRIVSCARKDGFEDGWRAALHNVETALHASPQPPKEEERS